MPSVSVTKSYYASLCFYALKQLGFVNGKVSEDYQKEADILNKLGKDFAFCAPAAGGPIFTLVYQIPASLNPTHIDDLEKIKDSLIEFIKNESIQPFLLQWPDKTKYWDKWYNVSWMHYLVTEMNKNSKQVIDVINYFLDFISQLWPVYQGLYEEKMASYPFTLNKSKCQAVDVFTLWENELGIKYPYDEFQMVICPESPTSASSLGPQQIVFGAMHSFDMMENALVHEVGVRFMNLDELSKNRCTKQFMQDDYFGMVMLIETEVCFRKPKLLPHLKEDPFIRGMGLTALMEFRKHQNEAENIPKSFATWYPIAKDQGLL